MLTRALEKRDWMARHLERLESTARLVSVTSKARLDWPDGADASWRRALAITGTLEAFTGRGLGGSDEEVARFLLCDAGGPSSVE